MATYEAGAPVVVLLSGRPGVVLGLSDNPAYSGSEEPVYRVRYDDGDNGLIDAGESSLRTPEAAPEAAPEAPQAPEEPAAPPAEAGAEAASDDPVQ